MNDIKDIEVRKIPKSEKFELVTIFEIDGETREHRDMDRAYDTWEDAQEARKAALTQ